MRKSLAFFPWVESSRELEFGAIRLIPWIRSKAPSSLTNASLLDIDKILSSYADRPGRPVQAATLLEFRDWQSGDDAEFVQSSLFLARDVICVSALSKRRLFSQSRRYSNFDMYALVIQNYEGGFGGHFAFNTRRRDGGTNQFWSSDEYAFFRPHHVPHDGSLELDEKLLSAIADVDTLPDNIIEAIREFNLANSDSPNVLEHMEMVMMKSAFENLFDIDNKVSSFVEALCEVVPKVEDKLVVDSSYADKWRVRFPKAQRLIECWAREFCDLRGQSAHGRRRSQERFVWPEFWHLAFASILFPVALKTKLRAQMGYSEDTSESAMRQCIERLLTIDPNTESDGRSSKSHPWTVIRSDALFASLYQKQ